MSIVRRMGGAARHGLIVHSGVVCAVDGRRKMEKAEFVALCVEEGLLGHEAEAVWDNRRATFALDDAAITEGEVRRAARLTLPFAKQLRPRGEGRC